MEIVFLGTGTSHGVPMIACDCPVCRSDDPRNSRGRSSIHVVMDGLHIQVDAAPELRLQCIREQIPTVDLFLLTHEHADHVAGMDDLRRFCALHEGATMPVYGSQAALGRIREIFPYALGDNPSARGYPAFKLLAMPARLDLPQGIVHATPLPHGSVETLGLVFVERSSGRKFAYYTDCKTVPEAAGNLARGSDLVVLDGLRPHAHSTHMTIGEAIDVARRFGFHRTLLTHLAHDSDHRSLAASLPAGVSPAHDGLRIVI